MQKKQQINVLNHPFYFSLFQMYKYFYAPPLLFSMQPKLWFLHNSNNNSTSKVTYILFIYKSDSCIASFF